MKARKVLAFTTACVLAVVLAQGFGEAKPKSGTKTTAGAAVIMPAADMKWTPLDAADPSVMNSDLWGDHTKGAHGSISKFPAGFSAPLHWHSFAMKIVVVSGTIIHGPEGKPEVRLGPGSYLMLPANYRHTTGCDKSSECVFFIESNGKFDIKPVDAGKAPAK